MSDDFWNTITPEKTEEEGPRYFKFEVPGNEVMGVVSALALGEDYNGEPCPELTIRTTSGVKVVTAGQYKLKEELYASRPNVGDHIHIIFTEVKKTKAGTMKDFKVVVSKADDGLPF